MKHVYVQLSDVYFPKTLDIPSAHLASALLGWPWNESRAYTIKDQRETPTYYRWSLQTEVSCQMYEQLVYISPYPKKGLLFNLINIKYTGRLVHQCIH